MKDNTVIWIIVIAILVFLILPKFQSPEPGMIGLTPHYYKDGVEVFPEFNLLRFSIVTPPGGSFDQIKFDISGTNTGPPIELKIVDSSPLAFSNALPTTTQNLAVGESKLLWTSALMDTSQFEAVSPINFRVNISGEDKSTGELVYRDLNSGSIIFEGEPITGLIEAHEDTYVYPGSPSSNYGSSSVLYTDNFPDSKIIYSLFNLSSISNAQITENAILSFFVKGPSNKGNTIDIYYTGIWDEDSLNFINQPSTLSSGIRKTFIFSSGGFPTTPSRYHLVIPKEDIQNALSEGYISFKIQMAPKDFYGGFKRIDISSKEGGNSPYLELTYIK